MRNRLLWKILAINVPVIGLIILVVWVAVDVLAAHYFTELMKRYNIEPSETHAMFVASVHSYLIDASIVAVILAALLSFLLTRTVLRPLSQMNEVSQHIAAGDYTARVEVRSHDEVGQLGHAFNRMADNLEKIERLRRTMVVDLAHELRTPLTSLRGYLEAIDDGVVTPSTETLRILQDEIMRLVRLVESLNQLTKADAARAYLERQEVDLPALIGQALELDRFEFGSRGIDVETAFPDAPLSVTADRDKLFQVLRNLTQNAWQYTPTGGRLRVAVALEPRSRDRQLRQQQQRPVGRGPAADLRAFLPGGKIALARERRGGDRSRHRQGTGRGPWRDGRGRARRKRCPLLVQPTPVRFPGMRPSLHNL